MNRPSRRGGECRKGIVAPIAALLLVIAPAPPAQAAGGSVAAALGEDCRWVARSGWADVRSIVSAPLEIGRVRDISLRQVLAGAAIIGAVGITIALDDDLREGAKGIGRGTASDIQNAATTASWSALGLVYAAGVWRDRADWRHRALTGGESAVVSMGLVKATKAAFGRERPDAGAGPYRWFAGGTSFVSDAATPHFAVAESISEAFGHEWWAALPAYAAAAAVGVGRMGQDRHWASDVVGSFALGFATERLFSSLHDEEQHDEGGSPPAVSRFPGRRGPSLDVSWRF